MGLRLSTRIAYSIFKYINVAANQTNNVFFYVGDHLDGIIDERL